MLIAAKDSVMIRKLIALFGCQDSWLRKLRENNPLIKKVNFGD